ncbi:MAG: glycosyltransferase family 4 protein [Ignavibacteriaceae bacterium]
MNILIINLYAGAPSMGMEYRPHNLAVNWKAEGHKVLIVTASQHHLRSKQFNTVKKLEIRNVDGIEYLVIKTPEYHDNGFGRVFNILTFLLKLILNTSRIASEFKPDVVIASSTFVFDIFPAKRIASLSKAKLVFEVRDLWPLSIIELGGYSKWHPFILLMQLAENFAYRNADKIVTVLPKALDYMVEHGMKPEKFVYVPNGIVVEDWQIENEIPSDITGLTKEIKTNNNRIIGYAGNLGIANALPPLIDAMNLLQNEPIQLFIIGKGPEKDKLFQKVKNFKLENVHFIDAVPKTLIPAILDKLDILYIGLQNQPVFRFGISPNKLMDYMMAGKPIIQAIKAGNDITTEANCGISIEPENSTAIADAIKYLMSLSDEKLNELGKNGKQYCLRYHDYRVLSNKLIEAIVH